MSASSPEIGPSSRPGASNGAAPAGNGIEERLNEPGKQKQPARQWPAKAHSGLASLKCQGKLALYDEQANGYLGLLQ